MQKNIGHQAHECQLDEGDPEKVFLLDFAACDIHILYKVDKFGGPAMEQHTRIVVTLSILIIGLSCVQQCEKVQQNVNNSHPLSCKLEYGDKSTNLSDTSIIKLWMVNLSESRQCYELNKRERYLALLISKPDKSDTIFYNTIPFFVTNNLPSRECIEPREEMLVFNSQLIEIIDQKALSLLRQPGNYVLRVKLWYRPFIVGQHEDAKKNTHGIVRIISNPITFSLK